MRNPLVAFQFSENRGYMGVLQHGLKKRHVESLSCYTPRFSWRDTVLWEYNLASGLGDRPLVVVDAWDTIILGSKAEMAGLIPQNEILTARGAS